MSRHSSEFFNEIGAKQIAIWETFSAARARPQNAQGRSPSDFSALGQFQCILNVDAGIPDCVLDLGMAKQHLDRSKVSSGVIDHGSLRPPQECVP
jgi:hypothetical protein